MSAVAAIAPEKQAPPPVPPKPEAVRADAPDLLGSMTSLVHRAATSLALAPEIAANPAEVASRVPFGANAVLTVQAQLANKWYSGERTFDGAAHVSNEDQAREATRAAYVAELAERRLQPRLEGMRLRGELLKAFSGKGKLPASDWHAAAFYCHTCGGCNGHGSIPCNQCDEYGQEPCPSFGCSWGKETCGGCHGRGVITHSDRSQSYCTAGCGGTGKRDCSMCWGRRKITCRSCRGDAWFACQPCARTGRITQAHGFHLEVEHVPEIRMADCMTDGLAKEWVAGGLKGAADTPDVMGTSHGSKPLANIAGAVVKSIANEAGKAPRYHYCVLGSFVEAGLVGSVAGNRFTGWAVRLERTLSGFAGPCLDAPAKAVAAALEASAAKGTPSGFARDAARFGALGTLLGAAQGGGEGQRETADAVETLFAGGISRSTADRIAGAQAKCVADFGKAAAKAAWRWPNRLLLAAPLALVAMDLPWAAYSSYGHTANTVIVTGGIGVAILLVVAIAEGMAKRALRREVGSSRQYAPNVRGRRLAAGSALACLALLVVPWFGVDAPPLRAATQEFREIVGLPHVPCADSVSRYQAYCGTPVQTGR